MFKQTPKKRVLFVRRFMPAMLVIFGVFSLAVVNLHGSQFAQAATASTVNFQARLQTASGAIVPDGNYNVEFKLYSASSGGAAIWTEDYLNTASQGLKTINGYLTANLGSVTAFSGINWDQPVWMTMNIGGTTTTGSPTWDGEMNPRLPLTAVPYAFSAGQLATTNGANRSNLTLQAPTGGNQNFVIQDQGAAGTYNLLTTSAANNSFVQLQGSTPGTAQTGNINVTGAGIFGGLLTGSAGITVGGGAIAFTGTGASSLSTTSGNALTLTSGAAATWGTSAGALTVQGASGITISSGAGTTSANTAITSGAASGGVSGNITIDSGSFTSGTPGIIVGGSNARSISIGNTVSASTALNLYAGSTGGINIGAFGSSAASSKISIANTTSSTGTQTVAIGSNANAANSLTLEGGNTGGIQIGASNFAHTIGIGSGGSSTIQTVTVGSQYSTSATTIQGGSGGVTINGSLTASSNITIGASAGSGTVLTNNGATVNSVLALSDISAGGSIGTAAATVDIYTAISIAQTTASKTLTLPSPTATTAYGRIVYISNVGTTLFTLLGTPLNPGATATLIWANTNGAASWTYSGADGNSILNQSTSSQSASFNISGSGTFGTAVTTAQLTASGQSILGGASNQKQVIIKANASQSVSNPLLVLQDSGGSELLRLSADNYSDVFLGSTAGSSSNGSINYNTFIGSGSGASTTSGKFNSALGYASLGSNTINNNNTAFGTNSLTAADSVYNSAFGSNSAMNVTSGYENTAFGGSSLNGVTTGYRNTAIGSNAGATDTGGSFVTLSNIQNSTAVGAYAQVQANNSIVFGSVDTATKVGIGITIPQNTFSVSPVFYSTGTASQSTTTVTGSGTTWTSAMIGMQFIFANGATGTITAVGGNTSLTLNTSQTVTSQTYRIHTTGFQVTSAGNAFVQNTNATALSVQNSAGTTLFNADTTGTGTVTVTGGLTQTGGAISLSANANSSVVSTGALNLTGGANSAWGTSSGSLTITGQGNLTLDSGTGTTTAIANSGNAHTISIGTGAAAQTITLGSSNTTSSLNLRAGTSGIQIGYQGVANTILIGNNTGAVAQTINIGTNATASSTNTVVIGSTIGSSITTIQSGSGGVNLSASPVNINTSGSSTTTIGNSSSATAINGAFTVVAPTNGKDINIGGLFQSACGIVGCNTIINGTGGANITFDNGSSDSDLRITATTHLKSPASNQTAVSIEAAGASSTVPTAIIRQGATPGSAADVLQIQNSSATILGGFNNVGQLYYKNSTFLATISVATLSSAQTITLPNASGTVCLDSGNCSAAGAYIINSASSQTGNINITGTANFGTSVTTAQLTSNGTTLVKTTATAAFQIQDASTNVFFTANTSTGTITFGSGSNTVIFTAAGGLVASGTAQHTKQIALSAEYAGAVLDAASDSSCSSANNGSMTSGYDGTNYKTYYKWISSASAQCYDVVLRVALPSDFNGWSTTTPLTINTYSADTTTGLINVDARDTSNVAETSCAYASATPGSNTTWTNTGSNCTLTGTYAANGTMTLRIRMTGNTSSDVRIGGITLSYSSKF